MAILFSRLNLTDVKTGLLEERGFCPLDPGYFAGEGSPYQKFSATSLENWKREYPSYYSRAQLGIPSGLKARLGRMDSLVQKYFVPALSNANAAPLDMNVMQWQSKSYSKEKR